MHHETVKHELPPLNALRAFEAAARHRSFTQGARELGVTQAAVSHQVRILEDWLGVALFVRRPRALSLTAAGERYFQAALAAFQNLDSASRDLRGQSQRTQLHISVLPSFAARWLVPRLGRFAARHPEFDVRIATSADFADFKRDQIDLAIRYGRGSYPGLRAHYLMGEELFPVCSPDLLAGPVPLRSPADLVNHTLLHDESRDDWGRWLAAVGVNPVDARLGPLFTDASLLIQAAVAGQGVGLARRVLVATELAAKRLVRPFAEKLVLDWAYYLVYPHTSDNEPHIQAFRGWLFEEIALR